MNRDIEKIEYELDKMKDNADILQSRLTLAARNGEDDYELQEGREELEGMKKYIQELMEQKNNILNERENLQRELDRIELAISRGY